MIDKDDNFSHKLTSWYNLNKRDLPWRNTRNPYLIWLSEIILQQTRVAQGMDYFLKFKDHYPTVQDLANASEDEVLKDWQGLGYYSRARNLHDAAKYVAIDLNGDFPKSFEEIKKLKGVGDYTAAAIASFAFKLPHAVVDGNVYRVLARYFGIETAIDSTIGKKEFQAIANSILNSKMPDMHNQAIMEFGALQCTPKNPNCMDCPVQNSCRAFLEGKTAVLPFKVGKIKQRKRYFHYFIIQHEDFLFIQKREGKGIWQNLFQFPLIESENDISTVELEKEEQFDSLFGEINVDFEFVSDVKKHILSHQILLTKFYHLRLAEINPNIEAKYTKIHVSKFSDFAVPKLIENYVREETNLLSLFQ